MVYLAPALRQVWFGCTKIAPLFCAIKSAISLFSGRWLDWVCSALTYRILDIADLTFGLAFLGCILRFWSAVFFAPSAQRGRCPHALRAPLPGGTLLKKGLPPDPPPKTFGLSPFVPLSEIGLTPLKISGKRTNKQNL